MGNNCIPLIGGNGIILETPKGNHHHQDMFKQKPCAPQLNLSLSKRSSSNISNNIFNESPKFGYIQTPSNAVNGHATKL
jgi:hypothetical protein